jgi:hypothetical protein
VNFWHFLYSLVVVGSVVGVVVRAENEDMKNAKKCKLLNLRCQNGTHWSLLSSLMSLVLKITVQIQPHQDSFEPCNVNLLVVVVVVVGVVVVASK